MSWRSWAKWFENGTQRFYQKCIRDAFVENPTGEWEDLIDSAMDRVTKNAVVHDRRALREILNSELPEQVTVYRDLAIETCSDLMKTMPEDVTLKVFEGHLKKAISGELVDSLAEETEEYIDDSVGLRRAMLKCAILEIMQADFSDWDAKDMKGRIANACPKCDRLFRDLAKGTCQNCGHLFEVGRIAAERQG